MGYDIRAWLDQDGIPQLQIIDTDTGAVRLAWDCRGERAHAIKSLFHDLMLLSVRQELELERERPPLSQH